MILFNEKKIRKIRITFYIENWHFLSADFGVLGLDVHDEIPILKGF